jgi:hypothetical protein
LSTKAVTTRIQHKHDLEVNWLKAVNFVPMQGELIIYDAEVDANGQTLTLPTGRTTPYTYERFKIGDGKTTVSNLGFAASSEADLRLAEDLYTYADIGKITGATNKNPIKVASVGETLKTVFNAVFGEQADEQPSIGSASLGVSQTGSTSVTGGEYGKVHSTISATVTFTLTDSVTCNYGYRIGDTKTTGLQTVEYPITKQSNADIKITLPSGQTASSSMVTTGSYVSHSSNVLYCNFDANKRVTISFTVPAGNTTTAAQTRYNTIKGEVVLGNAKTTSGAEITKFLTMQKNDASASLSGGNKSNTSTAYTITAGYVPYTYQLATATPSSLPTANRTQNKPTSITVSGGSSSTYLYIFVPSSKSDITSLTASGFDVPFSKIESSKSYVVNDGQSTTYKVFKTTDSVKGDTFKL